MRIYSSNFQYDESDGAHFNVSYQISLWKSKLGDEFFQLITLDGGDHEPTNYRITYLKTVTDNEGITKWFSLSGNPKFNIVKEVLWAKPVVMNHKNYRSIIIFCSYDGNERNIKDIGFLSKRIN